MNTNLPISSTSPYTSPAVRNTPFRKVSLTAGLLYVLTFISIPTLVLYMKFILLLSLIQSINLFADNTIEKSNFMKVGSKRPAILLFACIGVKISNNKFEWNHPEIGLFKMNKKDIQSDMNFKIKKEK